MSKGGAFTLMVNDGAQDALLLATGFLHKRINTLKEQHRRGIIKETNADGDAIVNDLIDNSWVPDINNINKTHTMFVNGSFKPFVSSGFEYSKISPSGLVEFNNTIDFVLPKIGDFINDSVIHIKLSGLKSLHPDDRVRYASFLGHKILSRVAITLGNNLIDSYGSDEYNAYYEFQVPAGKKTGWLRNIGQEIPNQALLTSDPIYDTHREYKLFGDGNQTFKHTHSDIELWIPLLFWFKNLYNALPNIALPIVENKISITLPTASSLIGFADYGGGGLYTPPTISTCDLYINSIFVNAEVRDIFMKKYGFSLIRVHTRHTASVNSSSGAIQLNGLKWPTESIYIAFKPQANLSLSQHWYKSSVLQVNDIKVPVVVKDSASLVKGKVITATANTAALLATGVVALDAINNNFYNDYTFVITGGAGYSANNNSTNVYALTGYTAATKTITINGTWSGVTPNSTTTYELFSYNLAINTARYYKEVPSIKSMKIVVSNTVIYRELNESFYNSYLPYRFGDNTPTDRGWYRINFCFKPGEFQPSGHINVSVAREFYLHYVSEYITQSTPVQVIVLADAINFLVNSGSGGHLRYAT